MNEPRAYDVGIVGLGYVGLTLATVMAEVGYSVIGIERRQDVVDLTNAGTPHFSETGLAEAMVRVVRNGHLSAATEFAPGSTCQTYIITVGTPLSKDGLARLDMIEAATRQVAENMPDNALIILRSTVKISTARTVVAPILEASGKRFAIAMCPERTLEGKALTELRELPQIVGADTPEVRERAANVFRRLTNTIVQVSSLEAAEIVKLVDNTYRDVQFGFANEVARVCEAFGVNAMEVISSGKLGYQRTNVPLPGLVGGPCLEKDPHILAQSARGRGVELEITRSGRMVNERQSGAQARQHAKTAARNVRERELGEKQASLPDKKYGVIVADPEWRFEPWSRTTGMDRAADNHYPTSCLEVIASRDVDSIAADDSALGLWGTVPMLREALAVMEAWGFEYKTHWAWAKDRIGTGYWNRNAHEIFLLGTRGKIPAPAMGTQWKSIIEAPAARHSAKPEIFLQMMEQYFPTLPKIELNRRGAPRSGWDAWGNETTESAGMPSAPGPACVDDAPQPLAHAGSSYFAESEV